MNGYDILPVLATVVGFVLSIASVGVRFTRAVGEVKAATEALREAVAELRQITCEIKKENRSDHARFEEQLKQSEVRFARIEEKIGSWEGGERRA